MSRYSPGSQAREGIFLFQWLRCKAMRLRSHLLTANFLDYQSRSAGTRCTAVTKARLIVSARRIRSHFLVMLVRVSPGLGRLDPIGFHGCRCQAAEQH